MKSRCGTPSHPDYPKYGGRGIKVCDRWLGANGFANFLADMGARPSARHSLDRVDNDGNYEPGNCRWATRSVQNANRRTARLYTFRGETLNLTFWARRLGIKRLTLRGRLEAGWTVEEAFTTPVKAQIAARC